MFGSTGVGVFAQWLTREERNTAECTVCHVRIGDVRQPFAAAKLIALEGGPVFCARCIARAFTGGMRTFEWKNA